jgi:hypothetical protein
MLDLWTTYAGSAAFLLPPAALGANATRRQVVRNSRQDLDYALRQLAVRSIKMLALMAGTRRSNTKDLIRLHRARQRQHLGRRRTHLVQIRCPCHLRRAQHKTKNTRAWHLRAGTWT